MSMKEAVKLSIQPTDHPHIARVKELCDGKPTIKGTRITVSLIATLFKAGDTVDDILQLYPNLSPAQVYDAISYYLDHQVEVEKEIKESTIEKILEKYNLELDPRGVVRPKSES